MCSPGFRARIVNSLKHYLLVAFLICIAAGSVAATEPETLDYLLKLNSESPTAQTFWLEFSHDGKLLVGAGLDKTVRIWDVSDVEQTGQMTLVRTIRPYEGGGTSGIVFSARFSPDDSVLAVGTNLGCYLFDVKSAATLAHFQFAEGDNSYEPFQTIAFSPDGRWLATGHTKAIRFWDMQPFWTMARKSLSDDVLRTTLSQQLQENAVRVEAHAGGQTGYSFYSLEFAPLPAGHYRLLSTSDTSKIEIWNNSAGRWNVQTLEASAPTLMGQFLSSPTRIVTASEDKKIQFWDLELKTKISERRNSTDVFRTPRIAVLNSVRKIALGNWPDSGQCAVLDTKIGQVTTRFLSHDNQVTAISGHPNGRIVATSGSTAARICLWQPEDGRLLASSQSTGIAPVTCAFSANGRAIAYGAEILDAETLSGETRREYEALWDFDRYDFVWGELRTNSIVRPLEATFDLDQLIPATHDFADDPTTGSRAFMRNQLALNGWEIERYSDKHEPGKDDDILVVARFGQEARRIRSIVRSRVDAATLVSLGSDKKTAAVSAAGPRVTLQNIETEDILAEFHGHTGFTTGLAVSPDQSLLLHTASDSVLRLFSLRDTGHEKRSAGVRLKDDSSQVEFVTPKGAADIAGIQIGDLLLKSGEQHISNIEDLTTAMASVPIGSKGTITIRRNGEQMNLSILPRKHLLPLLSIHIRRDGRWVAWTEKGYYTCSPGADDLFGWQVNRGLDKAADFYPAGSFQAALYRPDVVKAYLESHGDPAVLPASLSVEQLIVSSTPPKVIIDTPSQNASIDSREAELVVSVTHLPELPVQAINVTVNGKVARALTVAPTLEDARLFRRSVDLSSGANVIGVQAVGPGGILSEPQTVKIQCTSANAFGTNSGELPDLYVVSVGVSEYSDRSLNLRFAAKDAQDFVNTLKQQEGKRFAAVHAKTIVNEAATRSGVLEELDQLRKRTLKPNDFVVVFLSGHGAQDDRQNYCFVTSDARKDALADTTVRWSEFHDTLRRVTGTSFLIIDTCHSGAATGEATLAESSRDAYNDVLREAAMDLSGVITFASCLPHELSFERPEWENGAFTKSLVEAFSGKGDTNKNGVITISELEAFVSGRVEELTSRKQSSSLFKSISVPSNLELASVGGRSD